MKKAMMSLTILTAAILSMGVLARAQVNGLDLDDPANQNLVKYRFSRDTDIPDGIAFVTQINGLRVLHRDHPEAVLSKLSTDVGLSMRQAEEFFESLSSIYAEYEKNLDMRAYKAACKNGKARAKGDGAFDTLSEFDVLKEEISQSHFERFLRRLDPEVAQRYQQALSTEKLSMDYVVFDQKELARVGGISNIDEEMDNLCGALAADREEQ